LDPEVSSPLPLSLPLPHPFLLTSAPRATRSCAPCVPRRAPPRPAPPAAHLRPGGPVRPAPRPRARLPRVPRPRARSPGGSPTPWWPRAPAATCHGGLAPRWLHALAAPRPGASCPGGRAPRWSRAPVVVPFPPVRLCVPAWPRAPPTRPRAFLRTRP
jgi:hypothetical protein